MDAKLDGRHMRTLRFLADGPKTIEEARLGGGNVMPTLIVADLADHVAGTDTYRITAKGRAALTLEGTEP